MAGMDLRLSVPVPLADVRPHPMNAKKHDLEALKSSLQEFGQTKALIVSRASGYILAGNGTHHAMRLLGWPECMVTYMDDLTEADELRELATDNKSGETKNDPHRLHLLLEAIRRDQQGLIGTGYDDRFADRLAAAQADGKSRTDALFAAAGIDPMKPATIRIPCTQRQAEEIMARLEEYAATNEMRPGEALHEIMTTRI
jgi:hypothetical protein